ncbi:thiamine phosphate synthase [Brevibacillus sp. TJ4]|uniref:thiamine phosphate synthase n=1 Tax=Brevibacillus sp. TJ4 TaxID=3234853 RepID=UPI003BA2048C
MRKQDVLKEKMAVYLVIGSQDCGHSIERTVSIAEDALQGGVGMLQLRDKGSTLTDEQRYQLGYRLRELCARYGCLFIVNDDVRLAIRLQADGVHVGQEDMPLQEVRALVGETMNIGVSAGTIEEALAAKAGGADCLGVGAMFATSSKADAGEPIGPDGLRLIREAVGAEMPIVGIGGITRANAEQVIRAGADGIAVISAITRADSAKESASALLQMVRSVSHG